MAGKENGLGFAVSVDTSGGVLKVISNDVTDLEFSTPRDIQESTGVDVSAMERILLLADMSVKLSGIFNDTADFSHDVFKTVPSTSVARTTTLAISGQSLSAELLYSKYDMKRSNKGELTWETQGDLQSGLVPAWS